MLTSRAKSLTRSACKEAKMERFIIFLKVKQNNKNNPLNHHGWERFVRLCLSFYINLKFGFQFNGAVFVLGCDLLEPTPYKRFIK